MAKSPELVPVKPMLLMVRATELLLVRVAGLGAPDWPTATLAQVIEAGEAETCAEAVTAGVNPHVDATPMASANLSILKGERDLVFGTRVLVQGRVIQASAQSTFQLVAGKGKAVIAGR
jgi:hypothetical protein